MWNNGNNGNGNGQQNYGGGGYGDDPYNRMNNAREQGGARFPFIEAGKHVLCLVTLEKFQHSSDGPSARVLYEVLKSDVHPVGSYVVKIYKLMKRPKFDSQASDAEALAQMCIALKGVKAGYPIGNDIRTLLEERAQEQLARGTVIECTGVLTKKGNWTNLYWSTVEQTMEQIVANRQRLEQKGIPQTQATQQGTGGQAPQYTQQQAQAAPPQYTQQQTQAAPPQYAPASIPWQGSPQAPQPQYAGAPMQPQAPQGGFLQQAQPQQPAQPTFVGPGSPGPTPQGANGGRPW